MKVALVTNSLAGSGQAIRLAGKIHGMLQAKGMFSLILKETEWDNSIYSYDQVWIIGGDGTINRFINQYADFKKPLAIFAGGTGNDFHALLYGRASLEDQLELVLHGSARPIDAGKCNETYFLNGVGIGFEGAVAKSLQGVNKLPGKMSFLLAILKHIFFYKEKRYTITSDERTLEGNFLMISVANGKRYGGGFYVAPLAEPNDGLLDINLVKKLSPIKRLRYMPVIEKGKHLSLSFIEYFQTNKIVIGSDKIIQAHLDGEYLEGKELTIELLPAQFNFVY